VVGRPTDWNDLVKREGVVLSRNILKEVEGMDQTVEKELVLERSTLERGRVKSRGIELSR
jgi:hypothetical protein